MPFQSSRRVLVRVAGARGGTIVVVAFLAIVLLVLQTGLGHRVLRAVGLSSTTTSFVELYFPDASALPSQLPPSDGVNVRFAIDNISPAARSVPWRVSESTGNRTLLLVSGNSSVPANRSVTVIQKLRMYCTGGRAQLAVAVPGSSTRIDLWLACPSHR